MKIKIGYNEEAPIEVELRDLQSEIEKGDPEVDLVRLLLRKAYQEYIQ